MSENLTAGQFIAQLQARRSDEHQKQVQRYFKSGEGEYGAGDQFIGVPMGQVFEVAKAFMDMPLAELETLLESPIHEARAGALKTMDAEARRKKTTPSRRKDLYDLYLRRIDRINNWDLVDVSAPYVVGGYLFDKPRDILYELARSENRWERRTAIVSTLYFVRQSEVEDAFAIAERLLNDPQDLIHKATGWALRAAGDHDRPRLLAFLDHHAATMARTMLRYAIEHLDPAQRQHYMGLKKKAKSNATSLVLVACNWRRGSHLVPSHTAE